MVNFNAAGVDVSPKELQVCVPSDRDEKCKRTFGVYKVKIEGLGTFYCTLENQKKGALKKEDFNVNKHLKALHIRFLPEQAAEENISSREFLKKAEFINIDSLLMKEEEEGTEGSDSQGGGSGSQTGGDNTQGGGSDNSGSQTSDNTQTGDNTSGNNQGGGGNSSITPGEGD